ncbi:hypothetical protein QAD02_001921 [Eretmocerus hayati]|uniref:Uncharacterized protein n=1 Tax=Eretmocerus hayati TaxID=131215 RepID=A0ACC2NKA4_9HYME|nr:hypothetical protein QAD02_001921 [Eretmocerus hayati]
MGMICRTVVTTFGITIAVTGILLKFYLIPKIVNEGIDASVKLEKGSEAYDRWENFPVPVKLKVYLFHVTNPEEVANGAKPNVTEVGPYVYDQNLKKRDIVKINDTLTYHRYYVLTFNAEDSSPRREDDRIVIANLPLMSIALTTEVVFPIGLKTLNRHIDKLFDQPKLFLETTPRQFLFDGITVNCSNSNIVCDRIKEHATKQMKILDNKDINFSLINYKNNSHDGLFTINSGETDVSLLGEVLRWNNSSKIDTWGSNGTCNDIYGTDSTIFPPHQTRKSSIRTFQPDICRSASLDYDSKVEYREIEGLRFVLGKQMLRSGKSSRENECFCIKKTKGIADEDGCLFDGAMELYNCHGAPIILTFPHLLWADERYAQTVDGLHPDPKKHQTFVDFEPNTGTLLQGSRRVQFNLIYRQIEKIDLTSNLKTTLMPVVWFDQGAVIREKQMKTLEDRLIFRLRTWGYISWSLIGLGVFIGTVGFILCMVCLVKSRKS